MLKFMKRDHTSVILKYQTVADRWAYLIIIAIDSSKLIYARGSDKYTIKKVKTNNYNHNSDNYYSLYLDREP